MKPKLILDKNLEIRQIINNWLSACQEVLIGPWKEIMNCRFPPRAVRKYLDFLMAILCNAAINKVSRTSSDLTWVVTDLNHG